MSPSTLGLESQAQLIELAYAAMIVRDLDSRILYWNVRAAEVYGWTKEEALGQVTHTLLQTQFPVPQQAVEDALATHGRWEGELIHTCHDGHQIIVSNRQALQRDADGRPVFILEVNLDITEQRRAEAEIRRLNAELEERVTQRTAQLADALAQRDQEIAQRQHDQADLQAAYKQLSEQAEELEVQAEELRMQNDEITEATHALAASEARYRTVADFTWDWEFWLAPNRQFVYISSSCERISGYVPQAFISRPALFAEIAHPEDRPQLNAALDRAFAGQVEPGLDYRIRRENGEHAWASLVFQPIIDAAGVFQGVRGSVRDMTTQRKAEAEAQRRAAETDAIFAAIVEPVVVFGPDGRIVRLNAAAVTAYGFDPSTEHGDGRSHAAIAEAIGPHYPDGSPVPLSALPSTHALKGETVQNERLLFRNRADTQWRTILVSAAPIWPDENKRAASPRGAVMSWQDVTDRETLLAQLQTERTTLKTIIDNTPAAIVVADAQARLTLANRLAEELYVRPVPYGQDFGSHAALQLRHPDGTPYVPCDLPLTHSALDGETFSGLDMTITLPDGERRDLLVNTAPIRDAAGCLAGAVGAFMDVSAEKAYQREREALLATAQMQAEELLTQNEELAALTRQLAESRSRLQAVIEQMPGGVVIAEAPSDKIIITNRQVEEILRGPYQATASPQGYLQYDSYRPDGSRYAPEEVPFARTMLTGEVVVDEEIRVRRGDGSTGVVLVSSRPIHDAEGRMVAGVVTFYDITERQALVESLRQARDELESRVTERTLALAQANADLQRQANQLQLLHEMDRSILAAESAPEIARVALHQLRKALSISRAALVLYDFQAQRATWIAVDTDAMTQWIAGRSVPLSAYRMPRNHSQGEISQIPDLALLKDRTGVEEILFEEGMRRYLSLPLLTGGQLLGSLNLWGDTPGDFDEEKVRLASQVADSLAIAMQSARLFEQVHTSRRELQALSRRLVETQENERRTIARELHDESGQALTALKLGLGMLARNCENMPAVANRLQEFKDATDGIMEELHRLAVNLRPASLDRAGLVPALRQYLDAFEQQNGLAVQLAVVGLDGQRLPPDMETALYRVTQEALTNVLRHAHAENVAVTLQRRASAIICIIEDDGVGFDVAAAQASGRLGLLGMRERVEMLGGRLNIESTPGAGATIFVEMPIQALAPGNG
jgi:PAS domain S-box-containing protein